MILNIFNTIILSLIISLLHGSLLSYNLLCTLFLVCFYFICHIWFCPRTKSSKEQKGTPFFERYIFLKVFLILIIFFYNYFCINYIFRVILDVSKKKNNCFPFTWVQGNISIRLPNFIVIYHQLYRKIKIINPIYLVHKLENLIKKFFLKAFIVHLIYL